MKNTQLLQAALEKARLNGLVDRRSYSLDETPSRVLVAMSGGYSVDEMKSILSDLEEVQRCYDTERGHRAYQRGRDSVADREAVNPYPDDSPLAEEWENGRNDAEVEAGEEYAQFCDPSCRDLYE